MKVLLLDQAVLGELLTLYYKLSIDMIRYNRAGACDVTSATLNRNMWHLYGNRQ